MTSTKHKAKQPKQKKNTEGRRENTLQRNILNIKYTSACTRDRRHPGVIPSFTLSHKPHFISKTKTKCNCLLIVLHSTALLLCLEDADSYLQHTIGSDTIMGSLTTVFRLRNIVERCNSYWTSLLYTCSTPDLSKAIPYQLCIALKGV